MRNLLLVASVVLIGSAGNSKEALAANNIVYLNFDGAQLTPPQPGKGDYAARGESELVKRLNKKTLNIPATQFPTDLPRDITIKVILADIKKHYAGLDITWVTQRPIDDRYSMVVIGGSSDLMGVQDPELGWGPTDCGNQNPRNVAFVFPETIKASSGQWNNTQIAATISQEIAHALGLEHVDGPDDLLMRPVPAIVGEYRFGQACHKIVPGPVIGPNDGLGCGQSPGCADGQQNDQAALEAVLGRKEATPGAGAGTTGGANGQAPGSTAPGTGGDQNTDKGCSVDASNRPWLALVGLLLLGSLGRRSGRAIHEA